jgi:Fe2+ or Zn2+ uptake regulation protein
MQISIKSSGRYANMLREAGFRATYGRVTLLQVLAQADKPMSVEAVAKAVRGKLDLVNTYRALEALTKAALVARVDVGHRHIHYALAAHGRHTHQFMCTLCGLTKP